MKKRNWSGFWLGLARLEGENDQSLAECVDLVDGFLKRHRDKFDHQPLFQVRLALKKITTAFPDEGGSPAWDLHEQAMAAAEQAIAWHRKTEAFHQELTHKALRLEKEAAYKLRDDPGMEPLRSVLFRSAAWMAYDAEHFREAEQLCAEGLAGNPPRRQALELRTLLQEIWRIEAMANDLTQLEEPNA